jgi:hypothetical protein
MAVLYRIRVKRPDLEVEVESTDREYVDAKLNHYLNIGASMEPLAASAQATPSRQRPMPIGEFVRQVNPEKKNEVAAAIAYFLEYHAVPTLEEWKPDQLADRFPDVRKPKPANMTDLLVKSSFFMGGREKGAYRLSETGVDWVEAQSASHEG